MSMKKVNAVYETSDYELFRPHVMNRLLDDKPPRAELVRDMQDAGFRESNPIHVVKDGRRYTIKQGHNRFKAAKKAGVPIKVIITKDDGKKPQDYIAEKPWSLRDLLISYAEQGLKPYEYAQGYVKRYRVPLNAAIQLLSKGGLGQSGSVNTAFRNGDLRLYGVAFAESIGATVTFCRQYLSFAGKQCFIAALVRCAKVDGFDLEHFERKVASHAPKMDEQPNMGRYIEEIERIYNMKSQKKDRLSIAYPAKGM